MDTVHIDALLLSLRSAITRRGLVTGLTGGVLATGIVGLGADDAEARKKGKRRKRKNKKRKNKKRRKNRKDKDRPKVRVDATCAGSDSIGRGATGGDSRIARTFTAERSGALVKARIPITKELGGDGDLELRLSPLDDAGFPVDQVLAVSVVSDDAVPDDGADVDFTFSTPFSVEAGADYALVLTRPGGDGFAWFGFEGAGCGGRAFFSPGQAEPFEPEAADFNLVFTTFVKP